MSTAAQTQLPPEGSPEYEQLLSRVIENTKEHPVQVGKLAAHTLGVAPERMFDLLNNVWSVSKGRPPLTRHEMFQGVSMIARYRLDPIAREIYVTRDNKDRLITVIGIDGWVKILDRTEHYDGFEQDLEFAEDPKSPTGQKLVAVTTTIYSKQRSHPVTYKAYAWEYANLAGFMHDKIPWHMLRLFSLRHAARLFVPLGANVVTEEEATWMMQHDIDDDPATAAMAMATGDATQDASRSEKVAGRRKGSGGNKKSSKEKPQETSESDEAAKPKADPAPKKGDPPPDVPDSLAEYASLLHACEDASDVQALWDLHVNKNSEDPDAFSAGTNLRDWKLAQMSEATQREFL